MNAELKELYQQVILDHNRNPKNFGRLEPHNHESEGFNPLCGDRVHVYLDVEGDTLRDIRFEGSGCAISKASASLMTTLVKDKKLSEVQKLVKLFHDMVTGDRDGEVDVEALGKLAVLSGVREFPSRVKCASLAWHTLVDAINQRIQEHEADRNG